MFEHMLEHRLMNRPKIALLISKENFASLDFARFRRLSTAIGRFFSVCRRLIDTWSSKKDRREAIYRFVKIEVEVDTRAQLQKALGVGVDAARQHIARRSQTRRRHGRRPRYPGVSGRVMHETASAIAERAS